MLLELLLQVVLPSAGVAALVFALVRGSLGKNAAAAAAALAVLAGFAEVNALSERLPWWPVSSAWSWTLPATALAAAVEVVSFLPVVVGVLLRLLASGLIAWWVVPEDLRALGWWVVPVFAVSVFAGWQLLFTRLRDLPDGLGPVLLAMIFCGGAATVLIHAHTARFTEAVLILASGLFGVAAGALLSRDDGRGAAGPVVVLVLSLLLSGWTTTDSKVPTASFFLVGLAPLAVLLTWLPPLRTGSTLRRGLAGAVLVLLPVLVAVLLAVLNESVEFE
jgi:hypothetical protein